jgi:hypothetical protein
MIETEFQLGELVWFTFDGAVPRLGVVSAITSSGLYRVIFGKQQYWIPEQHVAKHSGQ